MAGGGSARACGCEVCCVALEALAGYCRGGMRVAAHPIQIMVCCELNLTRAGLHSQLPSRQNKNSWLVCAEVSLVHSPRRRRWLRA